MDNNVQKIDLDEIKKAREALNKELGIEPPKTTIVKPKVKELKLSDDTKSKNVNQKEKNDVQNLNEKKENKNSLENDNLASFGESKIEKKETEDKSKIKQPKTFDELIANLDSIDLLDIDLESIIIEEEEQDLSKNEPNLKESESKEKVNKENFENLVDNILKEDKENKIETNDNETSSSKETVEKEKNNILNPSNEILNKGEILSQNIIEEKNVNDLTEQNKSNELNKINTDKKEKEDDSNNFSEPKTELNEPDKITISSDSVSKEISKTAENQENYQISKKEPEHLSKQINEIKNDNDENFVEIGQSEDSIENLNIQPEQISKENIIKNGFVKTQADLSDKNLKPLQAPRVKIEKKLPKIDDFRFIDIIKSDSFMKSDELTCIYGVDETKNVICQNFKEFYNVAVFGDNDEEIFRFFSSLIFSLTLKNSSYTIKFAICDSNNGSKFDVYNDLSHLFFNKTAKSINEIIDTLSELEKELEKRYENLAKINAKGIENFNAIMKSKNIAPMPYIILFFNNYTRAIHLDSEGKINEKLNKILKLGRLVGIYVNLVSFDENIDDKINFNLQTRISFKSSSKEISINRLGEIGAEQISSDDEYVLKTLYNDELTHIKVASISQKEVEILIKNIEK